MTTKSCSGADETGLNISDSFRDPHHKTQVGLAAARVLVVTGPSGPALTLLAEMDVRNLLTGVERMTDQPKPYRNWTALHEASLRQNQCKVWHELHDTGELEQYLQRVGQEAQESFEMIRDRQMKQPGWTMDQAERTGEEMVLNDLILVMDTETSEAMSQGGYRD